MVRELLALELFGRGLRPLHDNAELWKKAARPDALHPVKIQKNCQGKSRLQPFSWQFFVFSLCPKLFSVPNAAREGCRILPSK